MDRELLEDVFQAYFDARRNKRNTINQLNFEMDFEKRLVELAKELENKEYRVGRSVCFIVEKPVKREIFAADFRDRVVHHLVFNYINEMFDRGFIDDCYSCRKKRGNSYGIRRLVRHIRSCTHNYTERAYVLKLDLTGYFMSINRQLLYEKLEKRILSRKFRKDKRKELILYLLKEIVFNDPTVNCKVKGDRRNWEGLPASKSLFGSDEGCGLPIGNLTSQLFSNIYLNDFDHFVKRELKARYYGRYVDDFYIVDPDRERLKEVRDEITDYLAASYGLKVHPKKIYLQEVTKGVEFLGAFVKPHRNYVTRRSRKSINGFFYTFRSGSRIYGKDELLRIMSQANSYLGYMSGFKSYKLKEKSLDSDFWRRHYFIRSNKVVAKAIFDGNICPAHTEGMQ